MGIRRTEEFRNEAVRIALTSGLSQKQIAADLGITPPMISRVIHGSATSHRVQKQIATLINWNPWNDEGKEANEFADQ